MVIICHVSFCMMYNNNSFVVNFNTKIITIYNIDILNK